jgi:hypothetical protein
MNNAKENKIFNQAVIEKCGTCRFGKGKDLNGEDPPNQWVFCIQWTSNQPFNGWCSEWKS